MNAQPKFAHNLFCSFEILDADKIRFFSLWGEQQSEATATTKENRQLCEFFYTLNGGENFLNCCLFLAKNGAKPADFATIETSPLEFPEFYPETAENWDFQAWKTALLGALDKDGEKIFADGLNAYFAEYFGGKTLWERNSSEYAHLPVNSYLTNGHEFLQIVQHNGQTTFVFSHTANDTFALEVGQNFHPISAENIPAKTLDKMKAARQRYDEQDAENREYVTNFLNKDAERAEKAKAKAAGSRNGKLEKLFSKYLPKFDFAGLSDEQKQDAQIFPLFATETSTTLPEKWQEMTFAELLKNADNAAKAATKAGEAKAAADTSAELLKAFFELSNTATIEELKDWMVNNQKQLSTKDGENGAKSHRKQAAELYQSLKNKAAETAKAAEKAAETEKAAELQTTTTETATPKASKKNKAATQPAEKEPETELAEA